MAEFDGLAIGVGGKRSLQRPLTENDGRRNLGNLSAGVAILPHRLDTKGAIDVLGDTDAISQETHRRYSALKNAATHRCPEGSPSNGFVRDRRAFGPKRATVQ